ncbi:MAG: mono/diheme cytochrome c family protein [Planctomycetota bacterium]|jgi:mono/diheme cytochrome c family protein
MIPSLRLLPILTVLAGLFVSCGSTEAEAQRSGKELYTRYGCSSCHGATGGGGPLGPPLRDSAKYWQQKSLTDFLVDPAEAYKQDERLAALNEAYRTDMRPFSELTRDQLSGIADFVLSLK